MGMDQTLEVVEGSECQQIATWRKDYKLHEVFVHEFLVKSERPNGEEQSWDFKGPLRFELTAEMILGVESQLQAAQADCAFLEVAKAAIRRGGKVAYCAC